MLPVLTRTLLVALALLSLPVTAGLELRADDMLMSEILGIEVKSPQGQPLGEIRDLLFDRRSGKVDYVALRQEQWPGVDTGLLTYPVTALLGADTVGQVLLDSPRNSLSLLDDQPASAGASAADPRQFVRASEMLGKAVKDAVGRNIGRVEDLVVSLMGNRVRLALLGTADGTPLLVPMDALELRNERGELAVQYRRPAAP